MTRAGPA